MCSLSYTVDKALAEVQKGVQLSSLCLPSSTPLNINACTHTSHIHGYFNCLQIFFNKGFDLLPLQLYKPFSVFMVMLPSSQFVLGFPAPRLAWFSAVQGNSH